MKLLKEKKDGKNYQSDGFKVLYRNKGSVSGDNDINPKERIYLISGKVECFLGKQVWIEEAPAKIDFPPKTYHKIVALTDVSLLLFEDK